MWPFTKRQKRDWHRTGNERWNCHKQQGLYILERQQREVIDMNSGDIEWWDNRMPLRGPYDMPRFYERLTKITEF